LNDIERRLANHSSIYFTRELLIYTLEGRRVELLTFSSFKDLHFERELGIDRLFPLLNATTGVQRPYKSRKPIIFISARVHPGEVPGSHIMSGILDYLSGTTNNLA
jgi:hypothetical protein